MANDLNQCNFIGRLGGDPEVRYMPQGEAVANFTIACNWKGKDKEGSEWVRIVVYGKLAEICGEYLRKGSKVFVSGKFKTRKWQDKDGVERYTSEIVCNEMQMLDSKPEGQKPAQQQSNSQQRPSQQQGGYQKQAQQSGGYRASEPPIDFDDDIPFAPIGLSCRRMLHCI